MSPAGVGTCLLLLGGGAAEVRDFGRKAQVHLLDWWRWRGIEESDVIGGAGIDRVATKV